MSKRRTYLHNAALLTGSGLVLRALGMGFRIVLAAYLGSEGMGLYQLILALYMVFVSFATAGVNVASARLAAQSLARGSGMAETLRGLCITALGFGTAAMLAQSVLAGPCARYLLHDVRAETALLILAPSLPFMAVSGAVRGCFLAARRVQPNITAQLIEQLVRMAVAAAGLRTLAQWGAGYGCAAVLLGNTVSESVSCGIMLAFAARTPEFAPRPDAPLHPYTHKELYDILWPVEGSRLLASALQAAESSLIPYTLAIYTGSRAEAVAQYGSLKGMALPLLFFPFSVLGALSGLLMPEITRAHTKGDTAAMRRLIFTMLRMTGAFSLAAGVGFVLLGAPLAGFIYRDAKVGRYVQLLGFVAPFMYLESMVDGVLKGLGEQLATFRYSLFDSVFRIAAIWLVVPQYGMMGFLGVMAVSNLMTCGLNMRRMMKQIKKPSPEGEGGRGFVRGRMRGRLAGVSREREGTADSPLISPLRGQLLPRGRSLWRGLQRFPAHQSVPQPVIYALLRQQLVVAALLLDAVAAQHQNAVRIFDRRQAVGNRQGRAALCQLVKALAHQNLALVVQGTCGLVQQQDARVLQKDAGNRQTLLLPAGQLDAALTDVGVVAVLQSADKGIGSGQAGSLLNFGAGRAGAAIGNVLRHRAAEQVNVLLHDADGPA